MYTFNSDKYSCLEILVKSKLNEEGEISLKQNQKIVQKYKAGKYNFELLTFDLAKNTDYDIEFINCEVSISYMCGNDDILQTGICFLEFKSNVKYYDLNSLNQFYDTPYREQYHFNPFKNWINDPNGLCFYNGAYHMYYQYNPNSQNWGNMYWGHVISKDLIHWIHLPIALKPQKEIIENPKLKGGAFSGSAIALPDKIVFYLTRHIGPQDDCEDTDEYQVITESYDSLNFSSEEVIIKRNNPSFSYDFRDPKVFRYMDKWHLVLGSTKDNIPTILDYISDDMKTWKYSGVILEEHKKGIKTIECPDFMQIGTKFVAVAALMCYTDESGRIQPTKYYIGTFKNNKFEIEATGLYDFGSNFYAVQSFEHNGRRIAIGWISDFYNEHIKIEDGAYGSMSIPRELSIKDGTLYMKPAAEVYSQKDKLLMSTYKSNLNLNKIDGNSYYVKVTLNDDTNFKITLMKNKSSSLSLLRNGETIEIKTIGVKSENIKFDAQIKKVENIEIFVDRRVVEVFINDGQAALTKVFYCETKEGIFETDFSNLDSVESVELYSMKSIW